MPTIPAFEPLKQTPETFPTLTTAQIDRLRAYGKVRPVAAAEVLFEAGDTKVPVFIILSGSLDIVLPCPSEDKVLVTHHAGGFSGEFSMITGQRAMVRGRVAESGEFIEVPVEDFRVMIGKDAELGELFMRVFILRRVGLIAQGAGNALLLGSRHSANTLRLREFLSRNGHPFSYVDLDTDERSQAMLDHFHVKLEDIPVVICNGRNILRNPTPAAVADCLGLNANIDESQVRDLIVVGAGPSGLAAAVYAASEGLNVLVVETAAPGGQAGSS